MDKREDWWYDIQDKWVGLPGLEDAVMAVRPRDNGITANRITGALPAAFVFSF
jgi:hypothetical protein